MSQESLTPEKAEERLKSLLIELKSLEGLANDIQTRMSMVEAVMRELRVSGLTVEGLEAIKENDEILVPIGGGSYIKARIADTSRIIVGIGASVAVEKNNKDAQTFIESQTGGLNNAGSSLQQQLYQVLNRMDKLRSEAQQISNILKP